jgi:hypothetical protein
MIALSSSCTSRDYDRCLGIDDCGGDPRPRLTSFTARAENVWRCIRHTPSLMHHFISQFFIPGQIFLVIVDNVGMEESIWHRMKRAFGLSGVQAPNSASLFIAQAPDPHIRYDFARSHICVPCGQPAESNDCRNYDCRRCGVSWYANRCWSCRGHVDSRDPSTPPCHRCGWYQCAECGKCQQSRCC